MYKFFKKYLIAHKGNGHHPHIFRTHIAFVVLIVILAIELCFIFSEMYPDIWVPLTLGVSNYLVSPQSLVEDALVVIGVGILLFAIIYGFTTKSSKAHATVATITIALLIFIMLLIMMNRTYLRETQGKIFSETNTDVLSR